MLLVPWFLYFGLLFLCFLVSRILRPVAKFWLHFYARRCESHIFRNPLLPTPIDPPLGAAPKRGSFTPCQRRRLLQSSVASPSGPSSSTPHFAGLHSDQQHITDRWTYAVRKQNRCTIFYVIWHCLPPILAQPDNLVRSLARRTRPPHLIYLRLCSFVCMCVCKSSFCLKRKKNHCNAMLVTTLYCSLNIESNRMWPITLLMISECIVSHATRLVSQMISAIAFSVIYARAATWGDYEMTLAPSSRM